MVPDVNEDGVPDVTLATGENLYGLELFQGLGNGTLDYGVVYMAGGDLMSQVLLPPRDSSSTSVSCGTWRR